MAGDARDCGGIARRTAGDGRARRIRTPEPAIRWVDSRIFPHTGSHLERWRIRRLPGTPELQAKWFMDQALVLKTSTDSRREFFLRQRSIQVGRLDRRRGASGRGESRPLSAPTGRGATAHGIRLRVGSLRVERHYSGTISTSTDLNAGVLERGSTSRGTSVFASG